MTDLVSIGLGVDSRQVREGRKELDKFGKQARKTQTSTEKFASSLKAGLIVAIAAVGASVIASIKIWREFSKAMSELSAITGAIGEDLKFYRQQAMAMGAATTFAASQVVQAFKLVASAKPDLLANRDALAEVTREVLTLAEAASIELPAAASALGGALNQFGAGAESASRFINVFAAGAVQGSSEINETAEAMKNAGAIASSLGLSFEETNAAIQALAKNTIKGAEAGTGLRGVLLKLAKQSNTEFNPEIVGLVQALENLEDANLSTTEKMKLFGEESFKSATALIQHRKLVGDLSKSLAGTDTAYQQARTNTNHLDGDIKNMGSSWERAGILLGSTFDPALRATVRLLAWIGRVASSIVVAFDDMGDALGAYAAATASLLTFEFDQAKAIMAARDETRAANQEKLDGIWKIKTAEELAAEGKKKADEAAVAVAAEALELEKQRAEAKKRSAADLAIIEKESTEKGLNEKLERLREHYMSESELAMNAFMEQSELIAELEEAGKISDQESRELELEALMEYESRKTEITEASAKARLDIERKANEEKKKAEQQFWSDATSLMTSGSKELFMIGKAASIAQAVIDGYHAAVAAWKAGMLTGGPTAPLVAAAYAAASLAKTGSLIASISSTQLGGGGSASTSGGSAGAVSVSTGASSIATEGEGAAAPATKELRIVFEGDNPHSDSMRQFVRNLEESLSDMGSDTKLVLST